MIRDQLMPIADTTVAVDPVDGSIHGFVSLVGGNMIGGLFVLPTAQGAGHGRALVEHVAAKHDPLLVEVFEANARARGFYAALGFAPHETSVHEETSLPVLILRRSQGGRAHTSSPDAVSGGAEPTVASP
eukprot:m.15538 g.15538  ORF g.15538 m.15538 type:complete len:130 (-) comp8690_c0_seq1:44-433(-)